MKIATNYKLQVIRLAFLLLFIGSGSLYAQFRMGNTLAPLPGSLYPIIYSNDAKGGFHQVATIADRDAIPTLRREQGMLCTVLDPGAPLTPGMPPKTYQLIGGILDTNWVEFSVVATSASFSALTGLPTTLAGYGITDGMSTAHPANGISLTDIANWNTAFGWGNHAGLYRSVSYVPAWSEITSNPFSFTSVADGQLLKYDSGTSSWVNWTPTYISSFTETDPLFTAWNKSTGISITASQVSDFQASVTTNAAVVANTAKISYPAADAAKLAGIAAGAEVNVNPDWNASTGKAQILNKPTTVSGYGITDAMTTAHAANVITSTNISNWNTAFGWGNHAGLYRSVSYVPAWSEITSNPFSFTSIADGQLLKYDSGTSSWVNWTPTYISSFTETDPLFTAWNKSTGISITASQVSDFQASVTTNAAVVANTAKISYPAADAAKLAGIAAGAEVNVNPDWNASTGKAQILNKPTTVSGYGITDAMTTAHAANVITSTNISNWNTAFGWGNHAGLYRSVSYVPAWSEITSNPFSFTSVADGQLLKYDSGTSSWVNWTPTYISSFTETDPLFTAWNKSTGISITASQVSDFQASVTTNAAVVANTAKISYPAADAAKLAGIAAGAEVNVNPDWNASTGKAQILNKPTTVSGYGITDAMTTAHAANVITSTNISNWNTAFGWGNHAGLYRSVSYVPAWSEITSNPFSFNSVAGGQLLKYNSGTSRWENWTPTYISSFTETDPLFTVWNKSTGISITASQVSDFQTSVTTNAAVAANTAKITNATHTGDVTGSVALTITDKAVTLSKMNDIATARILGRNTAGTGSPEALDATTVKAMLDIADNVSFNIDRPITLSGNNNTGKNLGSGGKTMSQFFEAFFFPSVAATPPTNTFTTTTIPLTVPYSTWKNWSGVGNPPSKNIDFSWSVTNNSLTDNSDDKAITSIKLKSGVTELATATPNGSITQSGVFSAIPFANVYAPTSDFSKTYTLEVIDAQPNTVLSNITLTMSKAIQLTYSAPTVGTTLYEYKNTNESVNVSWSITPNDEIVTAISVDGASAGSTASTGTKAVVLQSVTTGGPVSRTYPLIVTGSIYGAGASKNTPTVSWANRLYRGTITSSVPPSDGSFSFTDTQIKALSSETKLGGDWKATAGYDFVCGAGGQYVCFAYPDDAATPTVQYYDSNFSSWMTYSAADVTVINRSNFSNQFGYTGTNYKLVFINVQYISATVKIRLQ